MSDFEIDDLDEFDGDLPKKLRKQLDAALKALKEKDREIAELSASRHEMTVSQMLADAGINPKIAAFIPDDVSTPEEINEWLYEWGDVFGVGVSDGDDEDYSEYAEAADLIGDIQDGGIDPEVGLDLQQRIESASNPDELMNLLRSIGS